MQEMLSMQEMIFVLHCKRNVKAKVIRSRTCFLAILNPTRSTAESLVDCLSDALEQLDVEICEKESALNADDRPVLIGGGTDGASVTIGVYSGVKAQMQDTLT